MNIITAVYNFLWGDLITLPLPGGSSIGISLLVLLLVPAGIYFTIRTRFVLIRKFPHMIQIAMEKNEHSQAGSISGFQALIVATATRVGMGNLVGVVAAISAGGAGAVFWMWLLALLGSSTAFAEGTLAQIYRQKDPLYGGYRGGPAYYIHDFMTKKKTKKQNGPAKEKRYSLIAVLFAISGLICWCGISQVISNSVSSAMKNAFHIPPLYTTIFLVVVAAIVVLRKNATVHVLDVVVPIMAGCYLLITLFVILKNIGALPSVFQRIFEEAFGLRQVAAGGFGAVLMNGIKRGLFSNEAGSGSAPCAAAAADVSHPAKAGLMQAFGVFIDTILICTCSALLMLLAPADKIAGLQGMDLLQSAMQYHLGEFGVIFIAVILFLLLHSTGHTFDTFMEQTKGSLKNFFYDKEDILERDRFLQLHGTGEAQILAADGTVKNVRLCKEDATAEAGRQIWVMSVQVNWDHVNLTLLNEAICSGFWYFDCDENSEIVNAN